MKRLFLFLVILIVPSWAWSANYSYFFSNDATGNPAGDDTTGDGSRGNPWKSLSKANSRISNFNPTGNTLTLYFDRGDTWNLTSLLINRSNVAIDAYGSGNKPVFDGQGTKPAGVTSSGVPYGYAIHVGENSGQTVTNINIHNIRFQNLYPGGGIIFAGTGLGHWFQGPGEVKNCEFYNVGVSAITIYYVPNKTHASATALKIESNHIELTGEYYRITGQAFGWPQSIQTMDNYVARATGYSCGHQCRYNVISKIYGEGIGASGFAVTEYNIVSATKSAAIYSNPGNVSNPTSEFDQTIRYNLVWGDSDAGSNYANAEIRLDDEGGRGDNTGTTIEIYGNIIIGCRGLSIRNDVLGGSTWSPIGSVRVYNNTLIDNLMNINVSNSPRFNNAEVFNNALIIHDDASSECSHISSWGTASWTNWNWGPNFFYGGSMPSSQFYRTSIDSTGNIQLTKSLGWRRLNSIKDFSFSDLYPLQSSSLVDNPKVYLASTENGYSQSFLTIGTEFKISPDSSVYVAANQNEQGDYWDFGAIVFQRDGVSLSPPKNLQIRPVND